MSDYSVEISNPTEEIQRLIGFVESTDLKLKTMPGLVQKARRLQEKLSKEKEEKVRVRALNKIVTAKGTKILELKATTGTFVCSLHGVRARAVENERDLETAKGRRSFGL